MALFTLTINGQAHTLEAEPDMPLLWVLRDLLGYTGTKYSCGMGVCGVCTVHIDGQPRRSCVVSVGNLSGNEITTIEGLLPHGTHPVQKAWLDENVVQCGYCQPGQIMMAVALLASTNNPTDAEIEEAMSGVLCRCGTYQRIRQAIRNASREM